MINNIEQLKEERPDLVELFEGMSRDELLTQCYNECIDAINMEERVSIFMQECTMNMSETTYEPSSLKTLINERKEYDINEFCYYEIVDKPTLEELFNSMTDRATRIEK